MKKNLKILFLLLAGGFLLPAFTPGNANLVKGPKLRMSKKVNSIFQSKCYGCHNNEARSPKAKEMLNLDELSNYSAKQQLQTIQHIQTVLNDGTMPPSWFVSKSPEKQLTDAEAATLKKWASKRIKKLSRKI